MANKTVFKSGIEASVPVAEHVNEAGGLSHKMEDRLALAQLVATGTINDTFYRDADEQAKEMLDLARKVPVEFVAQCAVYGRTRGYMKDSPAVLCAMLATRDTAMLKRIFGTVIDNGKMLRNFVQIVRSGAAGRRSFGTSIKRLIQNWLSDRTAAQLLKDRIGKDPSLADVIKMVHPRPVDRERDALYAYLIGKEDRYEAAELPKVIRDLESFKAGKTTEVPNVDFRLLSSFELTDEQWVQIALGANWHMARMNLNTFERHGVFKNQNATQHIATLLADKDIVRKVRAFPYQLMTAFMATEGGGVPRQVRDALQDAMEVATENIPDLGTVILCVDTSGSMGCPVTGHREGATTVMTCRDVAALIASAVLRKNQDSVVIPFDTRVHEVSLNGRDTVMTNATKLSRLGGGGTDCGSALRHANERKLKGDLVLYVSDNESWYGQSRYGYRTGVSTEWATFKRRNKGAKMVCVDIAPYTSTQAAESKDVMNVGGFSDAVFGQIAKFMEGDVGPDNWVSEIEKIDLPA